MVDKTPVTIYLISNKVNGKQYVGQTVSAINVRWSQHKSKARRGNTNDQAVSGAIKLYGEDAFSIVPLVIVEKHLATDTENSLIKAYNTLAPSGYNLRPAHDSGNNLFKGKANGSQHGCAKLTDKDVEVIRSNVSLSASQAAQRFGVTRQSITNIRSGRTWSHTFKEEHKALTYYEHRVSGEKHHNAKFSDGDREVIKNDLTTPTQFWQMHIVFLLVLL